jgi:hypothetical protein
MHRARRGPSTGIEVEWLASLVAIEDLLKVSMREERASSEQEMGSLASESLESFDKLRRNLVGTELADELGVVAARKEREYGLKARVQQKLAQKWATCKRQEGKHLLTFR